MDWSKINKIYFIGIKGQGMTTLAQFLAAQGKIISGSDVEESWSTGLALANIKAEIKVGWLAANIPSDADLIIYSTAYNQDNPEVAAALTSKIKTVTYIEALADVFNQAQGIAVTGTHGKSTTTAWLGFVLQEAGLAPSVMLGATVPQFNGQGLIGKSNYLVIEADEYQNKLSLLNPKIILLNNIEYDHPDFYPDVASYEQAFADFVAKLPAKGVLVANDDDPVVRTISDSAKCKVVRYGINSAGASWQARDIVFHNDRQYFKVFMDGDDLGEFNIGLLGAHNISNALAVIAASLELGAELLPVRDGLAKFTGTTRRWEKMGEFKGALIYDDYAHHPTEIKATIAGARQQYPDKKIMAIFAPHTYSRTQALLGDFATSWYGLDELVMLPIYASAREAQGAVSSQDLIDEIKMAQPELAVSYQPTLDSAEDYLRRHLKGDEVVILMGAGDVFRIGQRLVESS
jgi:UDP-N-acetylmuramate--alanine ligase